MGTIYMYPRKVPGTYSRAGDRVIYFSDNKKKHKFRTQFWRLMEFAKPSYAKNGGSINEGCKITTPDGTLFHAIAYRGDLDGWKKQMEVGAEGLGLLLAWIEGDKFVFTSDGRGHLPKTDEIFLDNNRLVISDGRSFLLSECKIELY
jgi:hypothetical protein